MNCSHFVLVFYFKLINSELPSERAPLRLGNKSRFVLLLPKVHRECTPRSHAVTTSELLRSIDRAKRGNLSCSFWVKS